MGLSNTLVLSHDLSEQAKGTVFTLMLGIGVVLAGLGAALAPVVASLFDESQLAPVMAALSATVVLWTVAYFYESILQRELEFRARFLGHLAFALSFAAAGIVAASLGAGVWSLVAAQLGGVSVFVVVLAALAPYRVTPRFEPSAAREVYRPGRNFLLQSLGAFGLENADYFALGRALGAREVGLYSMAYRLSELPHFGIADPVAKVTFPTFARMRRRGEDIRPAFLSVLGLVALVACPLGVLLSATADPFTRTVFGDAWLAMIGPLAVLGLWAAVRPVQVTLGWLLNSVGEHGAPALIGIVTLVALVPALLIAADTGGMTAVAWVMIANLSVLTLSTSWLARSRVGLALSVQLRAVRSVALACVVTWVVARAVVALTESMAAGVSLAAAVFAGAAAYLVAVRLIDPSVLKDAAAQGRRMLGRRADERASVLER
jgi:PST family polysaccharide transporter